MRSVIPFVLLVCALYAGWIYWQRYTDVPLQERLLRFTDQEVRSLTVAPWRQQSFTLDLTEAGVWVITREALQFPAPPRKVNQLIEQLTSMRTDSVVRADFPEENIHRLTLSNGTEEEDLRLYFSPEGDAWASVGIARDVFALHPRAVAPIRRALHFNHYRDRRLLNERTTLADSVYLRFTDSLRQVQFGLQLGPEDERSFLDSLLEPRGSVFADNFDEVTQRSKQFAVLDLTLPNGQQKRLSIYRDTLWDKPFILVSPDFPRRYLAIDSLPFRYD
ncbi:hypothetical protein [Lewinella sp. W8]|uniref:hypothetical protein n=1 Tax=Lewinella sp. W8 TaxID=2528208 RepID=UPI0010681D5D|nr:hypothetical protein [Lewinella sp. W8]MTB52853.1 hypothetical protein [Lewinella sp. W8]